MVENSLRIVLDASVILKWFLDDENEQEQAQALRERLESKEYDVLIPSHCMIELFNTLSRKKPTYALDAFSILKIMGFKDCLLSLPVALLALNLTVKYPKISFYDAFYHAIALHYKIPFITADLKYYEMVKKEGAILLLKDFGLLNQ